MGHLFDRKRVNVRFFMTLSVNIARTIMGFAAGVVVVRSLGPAQYGDFNFLLASFTSIISLQDMGTSTAFYTFLSRRKQKKSFYFYYLLWLIIQFVFTIFLVGILFPESWRKAIWLDHSKGVILLAFMASFMMTKIWQTVVQVSESVRETVVAQKYNLFLALVYLFVVASLAQTRMININSLFVVVLILHLFFSVLLSHRLRKDLINDEAEESSRLLGDFIGYCKPLVVCNIASFFASFADIWFLQKFAGSVEQGFYAIALRFSAVCLIATSSMLNVFWKEVAESHEKKDRKRLHALYTRISQSLFFVGAVMACFFIPFSQDIIRISLGSAYVAAWPALMIMFLFPVYQSLGQINGSYLCAVSETKLYSILGIIGQCASIPLAYLLLAPRSFALPGLGLGAIGLALKASLFQIVMVNIMIYFVLKVSKWNKNFFYQPQIILCLITISFMIRLLLTSVFHSRGRIGADVAIMGASGILYCLCVAGVVYTRPEFAGITRQEIWGFLKIFKKT